MSAGLLIGLGLEPVDEFVGELGNVHQFGPRPRQRRTELTDEVTEAALAACDAVRLEKAHLRPPKTEAVPHDIVDLLGGGDTVVHEPERLAPHRLEKTIADEGVDLDSDMDRLHRHSVVGRHRCVDRVL